MPNHSSLRIPSLFALECHSHGLGSAGWLVAFAATPWYQDRSQEVVGLEMSSDNFTQCTTACGLDWNRLIWFAARSIEVGKTKGEGQPQSTKTIENQLMHRFKPARVLNHLADSAGTLPPQKVYVAGLFEPQPDTERGACTNGPLFFLWGSRQMQLIQFA